MDKHTIILEIPTPQNSISFKDGEELEKYILSIEDMRFLYIKEVTKKNEQLNVYNTDYRFNFDGENETKNEDKASIIEVTLPSGNKISVNEEYKNIFNKEEIRWPIRM